MPAGMVPVNPGRSCKNRSVRAVQLERNSGNAPVIPGIPLMFLWEDVDSTHAIKIKWHAWYDWVKWGCRMHQKHIYSWRFNTVLDSKDQQICLLRRFCSVYLRLPYAQCLKCSGPWLQTASQFRTMQYLLNANNERKIMCKGVRNAQWDQCWSQAWQLFRNDSRDPCASAHVPDANRKYWGEIWLQHARIVA